MVASLIVRHDTKTITIFSSEHTEHMEKDVLCVLNWSTMWRWRDKLDCATPHKDSSNILSGIYPTLDKVKRIIHEMFLHQHDIPSNAELCHYAVIKLVLQAGKVCFQF